MASPTVDYLLGTALLHKHSVGDLSNFPSQTGNAGEFLTTDGSVLSWSAVAGGVSDVTNSDSTLTISPTTGNVVASLNLSNANSWVGKQTFTTTAPRFSTLTTNGGIFYGNATGDLQQTGAGTATQVLHGGTSPSYSAVSLTADVSGILPVANGGSGTSTVFTTGSVIFAGASGVYSQDNSNLFWNDTDNYFSIGTASNYTSKLNILIGAATDRGAVIKLHASQSANAWEIQPSASSTPYAHFSKDGYLNIANTVANSAITTDVQVGGGSTTPIILFKNFATNRFGLDAYGNIYPGDTASGGLNPNFGNSRASLCLTNTITDKIYLYHGGPASASRWGFGIQNWAFVMFMDPGNPGTGKFSWRNSGTATDASTGTEVMNLYTTGALEQVLNLSTAKGHIIRLAAAHSVNALEVQNSSSTGLACITEAGWVGVGVTSSLLAPLHVKGNGASALYALQDTSGAGIASQMLWGWYDNLGVRQAYYFKSSLGALTIANEQAAPIAFVVSGQNMMSFDIATEITAYKSIYPSADNTYSMGSLTNYWSAVCGRVGFFTAAASGTTPLVVSGNNAPSADLVNYKLGIFTSICGGRTKDGFVYAGSTSNASGSAGHFDNGGNAVPILTCRDNGVDKFVIADGGEVSVFTGFADGVNIVVGSTTGTKIGTATTQKLAFFNSTPIVQPANSVSLETVLSNLGLRASGTSAPLAIGNLTIADAANIILDTTTGTKIGTATTQKLAFFNSTPIVQPANSVSLETVLSNLGLRASGTSAPLAIGNLTIADGSNVILDTTTGTKFGTATTQKIGFLNATPIVQQANSVSLEAVLSNFGFRASGTAAPISVGVMTATTSANVIAGTSSTAAKIGGAIADYYTDAGNVGTGETDLYSTTLAANVLGANGDKLVVRYGINLPSASGATVNIRMYFGGSAIFGTGALTKLGAGWMDIHVEIIRVSATTIRYTAFFQNTGYGSVPLVGGAELAGLTLSNTNVIKITGQAGAGGANNDIVAKLGSIKWYPAA